MRTIAPEAPNVATQLEQSRLEASLAPKGKPTENLMYTALIQKKGGT